jgi:hypothetical protein
MVNPVRCTRDGFSLTEALAAVVIFSLACVALLPIIGQGRQVQHFAVLRAEAGVALADVTAIDVEQLLLGSNTFDKAVFAISAQELPVIMQGDAQSEMPRYVLLQAHDGAGTILAERLWLMPHSAQP